MLYVCECTIAVLCVFLHVWSGGRVFGVGP